MVGNVNKLMVCVHAMGPKELILARARDIGLRLVLHLILSRAGVRGWG